MDSLLPSSCPHEEQNELNAPDRRPIQTLCWPVYWDFSGPIWRVRFRDIVQDTENLYWKWSALSQLSRPGVTRVLSHLAKDAYEWVN
jgi:hypothetical protein